MASLAPDEIASRFPVISADAIAPLSPGSAARMRASIASRSDPTAALARSHRSAGSGGANLLDGAEGETGSAEPLEIIVAREVVTAGPERRKRRIEARLQLDERCDRRRHALADGNTHALQFDVRAARRSCCARGSQSRSLRSRSSRLSTKPDKATLNAGTASTGCAMRAVFQVASAKPKAMAAAATATGNARGRARHGDAQSQRKT